MSTLIRVLSTALLGGIALSSLASPEPTSFNAYAIRDFYGTQADTEGALVVGGSFAASSYGINTRGSSTDLGLWVAGDASLTNGQVVGDVSVGGTWQGVGAGVTGKVFDQDEPSTLSNWETYYKALSAELSLLQPTGTVERTPWGALTLAGNGQGGPQVFNLQGIGLSSINQFSFSGIREGSSLVINVSGDVSLSNLDSSVFGRFDTVFNFTNAQNVTFKNTSLWADVLAPYALVTGENGHLQGATVMNSFKGSLEFHVGDRAWLTPPSVGAVPEPNAIGLFGLGLMGVGYLMYRKNSVA